VVGSRVKWDSLTTPRRTKHQTVSKPRFGACRVCKLLIRGKLEDTAELPKAVLHEALAILGQNCTKKAWRLLQVRVPVESGLATHLYRFLRPWRSRGNTVNKMDEV
jgi:hypothetical protein